jgi:hypothetical protein
VNIKQKVFPRRAQLNRRGIKTASSKPMARDAGAWRAAMKFDLARTISV